MSWKIDPVHSAVRFTVRHMMVANVHGEFTDFDGEINFDEAMPANSTVSIHIDAASINTGEPQRDTHLRSADFLQAEDYPQLVFKSRSIEMLDNESARIHGNLTIRDITWPVVLNTQYLGTSQTPYGTTVAGFSASTVIQRKNWGLMWNVGLESGGFLVGDDVTISLELELIKVTESELEPALV